MKKIQLEEIKILFSNGLYKILEAQGITTVKELFDFTKNPRDITSIINENFYDELLNTVKLLKCKYLNEDPEIDLKSTNTRKNFDKLGLSTRTYNALIRYSGMSTYTNLEEYLKAYCNDKSLCRINGMGATAKKEFMAKSKIVLDYYEKNNSKEIKVNKNPNSDDIKTLIALNAELKELNKKREEIQTQIDAVMEKINGLSNDMYQKVKKEDK